MVLVTSCVTARAQKPISETIDTTFRVRATVLAGMMSTIYDQPTTTQSTTTQYVGNALAGRVVWHPNHLLAVGLQSGFVFFSSDDLVINGVESGRAGLAAVPLHAVITMSSRHVEFGIGLGMYQLQSIWRLQGTQRAAGSDYEYGINPWLGYEFKVAENISMGPEIGAHLVSNRGMRSFYLGVNVSMDVVRY